MARYSYNKIVQRSMVRPSDAPLAKSLGGGKSRGCAKANTDTNSNSAVFHSEAREDCEFKDATEMKWRRGMRWKGGREIPKSTRKLINEGVKIPLAEAKDSEK